MVGDLRRCIAVYEMMCGCRYLLIDAGRLCIENGEIQFCEAAFRCLILAAA